MEIVLLGPNWHNSPWTCQVSVPSQDPSLLPTLLKSHPHFRDPRWESNSINQIIAAHTVGIPTRLRMVMRQEGCGKGEDEEKVCMLGKRVMHRAVAPEACWRASEKSGWGRGRETEADLFSWMPRGLVHVHILNTAHCDSRWLSKTHHIYNFSWYIHCHA